MIYHSKYSKVWPKISKAQKALDAVILQRSGKKHDEVIKEQLLALVVEIAEQANETQPFKFWKQTKNIDRTKALEEYVDGIHFFASLGNVIGFDQYIYIKPIREEKETVELYLSVVSELMTFHYIYTRALFDKKDLHMPFIRSLNVYLAIAERYGYTVDEILQAYAAKNEMNYDRQQTGY